jgi:hypothetical protein
VAPSRAAISASDNPGRGCVQEAINSTANSAIARSSERQRHDDSITIWLLLRIQAVNLSQPRNPFPD